MSDTHPTDTALSQARDGRQVFADPVGYLAELGIDSILVEPDNVLPRAA